MGKIITSLASLKYKTNNNLPCMVCYESVVKNIVDVALFLHNSFIFSCGWFLWGSKTWAHVVGLGATFHQQYVRGEEIIGNPRN